MEQILGLVRQKSMELLSSDVLEAEIKRDPDEDRRHGAEVLLLCATETIPLDDRAVERAKTLEALGYGAFDSLHLAAAEVGGATVLLTTDDRFLRLATRGIGAPRVRILNPVEWLKESSK